MKVATTKSRLVVVAQESDMAKESYLKIYVIEFLSEAQMFVSVHDMISGLSFGSDIGR